MTDKGMFQWLKIFEIKNIKCTELINLIRNLDSVRYFLWQK